MRYLTTILLIGILMACGKKEKQPIVKVDTSLHISTKNGNGTLSSTVIDRFTTILLDSNGKFKGVIYGGGCTIHIVTDTGKSENTWAGSSGYYPYNKIRIFYLKNKRKLVRKSNIRRITVDRWTDESNSEPIETHYSGMWATTNSVDSIKPYRNIFGSNSTKISTTTKYSPFAYQREGKSVFKITQDTAGNYTVTFAKSQVHFINDSTFTFKANK